MEKTRELKTGTTTVGVIGKDCVVLAADMRASMDHLAIDEETKKLYKITDLVAVSNAGSVGDCGTLVRHLRGHAKLYEIERETKITTKALSTYLANILNANRFYPFFVQFLIGGIDGNTAKLFEIDLSGGLLERNKYAVSGSGTELALSSLDKDYKQGLSEIDSIKIAVEAVKAAKKRDIYSGGKSISVIVINKQGARELTEAEVKNYLN